MKRLLVALILLTSGAAQAENYEVSVTRIGSNTYKVTGKEVYIFTRYCYEYVYYEDSILRMQGTSGKLIFIDEGESCDVKAVYGASDIAPGKYKVTVSHDDDWYEVFGTGTFIRTNACLSLALGEEALLKVSKGGFGTLYFLEDECI